MQTDAPIQGIFFKDFANSYIPQILKEIYIDRIYAPFLDGKKDLIIADFGGNVGLTSYYFKDFAKQVYCVEPSKRHLEVIEKMIDFNGITNIKVCPYAISNGNGKEKFYHPDNVTMYSMENVMGAKDFEEVETVTPLEFIKREGITHIDLLKLDVEGVESKVICSPEFKEIIPLIDLIVGEWHSWDSQSELQFANTFKDLGFDFSWNKGTEAFVFTAIKR